MTRRILAALVGLTALLLAGVVVPLGVFTASHDQQVFTESADASALGVASQAEEQLADAREGDGSGVGRFAVGLRGNPGDELSVYDRHGLPLAKTPAMVPITAAELRLAALGQASHRWVNGPERYVVIVPVSNEGSVVGIAALARPTNKLRQEQHRLWLGLAAAAVAALAIAGALGLALARWVGRPLRRLDAAAGRFGDGRLSARADPEAGPAELRALAVTFNEMAARLEGLLASQRTVIADVSHQLRTPLAGLRLRLELLSEDAQGANGADVESTLSEVNRLSHLVDGLLAVAKAENTTPAPQSLDVFAVTRGRVEAWLPVAADSSVALTLTGVDAFALVTPGHLEQILDNLIANAIEATPPGGGIIVEVRSGSRHTYIKVSDTGPGMSARQREDALRRFWSDDVGAGRFPGDRQGFGLGLAIADRLVTVDRGALTLSESPTGGLAATIELPIADALMVMSPR